MDDELLLYRLAAASLKALTVPVLQELEERDISLRELMEGDDYKIKDLTGHLPPQGLDMASRNAALQNARKELEFVKRHSIHVLWYTEEEYPFRLAQVESPPPCLFLLGDCDLNKGEPVSVVGTRKMTPYGADAAKKITRELASAFPDLLVVSGLAFGVDATAHTTALEEKVRTVGVVAHGLDMIYPAQHRELAKRIIAAGGGLLSIYPSGTRPFRNNFLERNRIVAGLSDATLIIESGIKGGAMSTARHAFEADREVLALPGRATDPESAGCNYLIQNNRAKLMTCAGDVIEATGWQPESLLDRLKLQPKSIFPELEGECRTIYEVLKYSSEPMQLDRICQMTGIPVGRLMGLLGELEFDGVILRHPGNRYSCCM